ncbi:MAG TPA: glycoside hydrolase family 16 protein, partial [Kofleriaceae bacterium]|nr:glycoside hydrolase family 16 protein [Kofleriaceae bacterium]
MIGLAISTFAASEAAAATSGFTITSSSSVQFWVHDAPWADVHYQINGGTQLNVRMVANGTNHTLDVSSVPAGAIVRYFFTIGSSTGGATATPWLQFTMS